MKNLNIVPLIFAIIIPIKSKIALILICNKFRHKFSMLHLLYLAKGLLLGIRNKLGNFKVLKDLMGV